MAAPLRPRVIPQCSACIRNYTFKGLEEQWRPAAAWGGQQVRGAKKKAVNASSTMPVRLLKDVKTFGKKGAIVPISVGQMRNSWFPRRVAEYVTMPELKTLRLKNTAMERDFEFGITELAKQSISTSGGADAASAAWQQDLAATSDFSLRKKAPEVQKITPERSVELVEIFVPPRLDFYRQPIIEEVKAPEPEAEAEQEPSMRARGAAGDLLAFRTAKAKEDAKETGPQAIYGSVSTHDVLMAVRAALEGNDESKRVLLHEEDIKFVEADMEAEATGRVKHTGDFHVEIGVKGAETAVRRTLRVNAQE